MSSRASSRKRTATQYLGREEQAEVSVSEGNGGKSRQRTRREQITSSTTSRQASQPLVEIDVEDTESYRRKNRFQNEDSLKTMADMKIYDIAVSAKQLSKWDRVSDTEKERLIKVVTRLLLMKGSTNDKLLPIHVKDTLGKINSSYQVHSQVVLREAQQLLKSTFGLNVETVKTTSEKANVLKESVSAIFVVNDIRSPALQEILSNQVQSLADPLLAGYNAFCHLVFVSIWTSPGRSIDMLQLLRNIRKVDPRFSESIMDGLSKHQQVRSGSGIEELSGLGFNALLQRMIKEGYVKETKDLSDPSNIGKRQITLGPRFYVEVGLKQIARSYFNASGVPVDESVIQELDRERKGYITGNIDESEDEEEVVGGHEEQKGNRP